MTRFGNGLTWGGSETARARCLGASGSIVLSEREDGNGEHYYHQNKRRRLDCVHREGWCQNLSGNV